MQTLIRSSVDNDLKMNVFSNLSYISHSNVSNRLLKKNAYHSKAILFVEVLIVVCLVA